MLATPVAATVRFNFPDAKLIYWTHPSLVDLLGLCKAIDERVGFFKERGVLKLRHELAAMKADLLVDLAGSNRSKLLTLFFPGRMVRYKKQSPGASFRQHAVDNFLATLDPLELKPLEKKFPTLSVAEQDSLAVVSKLKELGVGDLPLVGLVPGVGKLRPHRAWIPEGWIYAARLLGRSGRYAPVLIGGADEVSLCESISKELEGGCINLAGKLSLVETAAVLKLCRAVVSGDTGPAHMAVAVGTPVVGLYGPTFPERSGPFGCANLVIDQSESCRCRDNKVCSLIDEFGPGECMGRIMLEEVSAKLRLALGDNEL